MGLDTSVGTRVGDLIRTERGFYGLIHKIDHRSPHTDAYRFQLKVPALDFGMLWYNRESFTVIWRRPHNESEAT